MPEFLRLKLHGVLMVECQHEKRTFIPYTDNERLDRLAYSRSLFRAFAVRLQKSERRGMYRRKKDVPV